MTILLALLILTTLGSVAIFCGFPRPFKSKEQRASIVRITILFDIALFATVGYWIYNIVWFPPHYKLARGTGFDYIQPGPPTNAQKEEGKKALQFWKSATRDRQCQLADDLILSGILCGKTKQEVLEALGPANDPEFSFPNYPITQGEGGCELQFNVRNGVVQDVSLYSPP